MTLKILPVSIPPREELIFRTSASLEKVRTAGCAIAKHLIDFTLLSGLLRRNEEVGCLGNLPDWKPFEPVFHSRLRLRTAEIETKRTGPGNRDVQIKRRIVHREWGDARNAVIPDTCIAGASTQIGALIPEVFRLSDSIERIFCIVPIATKLGLERLDKFSENVPHEIVAVTGMIDPGVDSNGYIVPGVGPDFWTKRIPEKMGEIPVWSEYLDCWAQKHLEQELQGQRSRRIALNGAALRLIEEWQSFTSKPIRYRILERALHRLREAFENRGIAMFSERERGLGYYDAPNVSDSMNELSFLGFVSDWNPYSLTMEGRLFLNRIFLPCLKNHSTFCALAEELQAVPRSLFEE